MYSLTEVSAGLYLQSTHDLNHGNKMCTINLNVLFYCSFGVFPLCPHNPFFSVYVTVQHTMTMTEIQCYCQ